MWYAGTGEISEKERKRRAYIQRLRKANAMGQRIKMMLIDIQKDKDLNHTQKTELKNELLKHINGNTKS